MDDNKPLKESSDEMEDSAKDNDDWRDAFQDQCEESARSPTTLGSQVFSSVGQDASENQQPSSGKSTAMSPQQDPPCFSASMPVFESSDSSTINDRSSLGESSNTGLTSPPQPYTRPVTRSLSKQNSPNISPEKRCVVPGIGRAPRKRKRTGSDSGESGVDKSLGSNLLPSAASTTPDKSPINEQTEKSRATTQENEALESLSRSPTPGKKRKKRTKGRSSDSDVSKDECKSNLGFRIPATDTDLVSPTKSPTQGSNIVARNSEEYVGDKETSMSEKDETNIDSNTPTDGSLTSPKKLSTSGNWTTVSSPKKTLIIFKRTQPDKACSSKLDETSDSPYQKTQSARTESFESGESGKTKSFRSDLSPSAASTTPDQSRIYEPTGKRRAATSDSEESGSLSISSTPRKQKSRKQSSSSDSDASSSPTPATDSDPESPTQSNIKARNSGESETDEETSTFSALKGSIDSESAANNSDSRGSNSQTSSSDESDKLIKENKPEFASFSSNELQSALDIFHPGNETQMLASSQSRSLENPHLSSKGLDSVTGTYPPSRIFSIPHLPEQSNASIMIDPHQEFEPKTYDEKEKTDRNVSDSSTRTSKPYTKSRSESSKSLTPVSRELLCEALNILLNQDLEATLKDNSDPSLVQKHSDSISTGSSKAPRKRSGVETSLPYLDIREGQPSTSGHQPLVTDDSCVGDRLNTSPGVTEPGTTRKRRSNISSTRIWKYPSNAQKRLLDVLGEMMKFNGEEVLFRRFLVYFSKVSELCCGWNELDLSTALKAYLLTREIVTQSSNLFTSHEIDYNPQEEYETLLYVVVSTLISIVCISSCLIYDTLLISYLTLKGLREKFRNNEMENIQDEASRNHVANLKKKFQEFLLLTEHAFQLLWMHIGEHAEQGDIRKFEEVLSEEDKSYLRRRIP